MKKPLILASGSVTRSMLLRNAAVSCDTVSPRIDEDSEKSALLAGQASPRDIADTLAELKARKISDKHPGALVLGCDQVLDHAGTLLSKPTFRDDAAAQLHRLRGQRHQLLSAAVICEDGRPVWRHVGVVRLTMRVLSDAYLTGYLDRNWPGIADSVGGYKLEEEGVRLFSRIEGDYFTVLGVPLLELLAYLTLRGELES